MPKKKKKSTFSMRFLNSPFLCSLGNSKDNTAQYAKQSHESNRFKYLNIRPPAAAHWHWHWRWNCIQICTAPLLLQQLVRMSRK